MKNKYTLLLIPPGNGPTKQVHLPKRAKYWTGIGFLCLGLFFSGMIVRNFYLTSYIKTHQELFTQVEQMQSNLAEKDKEISHLQEQNNKITENLDNIQSLESKIATLLKLQTQPINQPPSRSINPSQQSYKNPDNNADLVASHLAIFQQLYDESVKYNDKLEHTPSMMPLQGEITSNFGYRKNPFGGWSSEFHDGIDIACNYGSEVRATASGVITYAGWDSVYGRKVEIDHGYGIVTYYGHNSRLIVKVGDKVKKGDVIAYSGNSGRSTGSHLHYGAFDHGKSVNPLMFTDGTKEQ